MCGIKKSRQLGETHQYWSGTIPGSHDGHREPNWTESIAVGSKSFVEETKEKLGIGFLNRKVINKNGDQFSLRESLVAYQADFDTQNDRLSIQNRYF